MRDKTILKSIPNAVTSGNLLFGFLSILATIQGDYAFAVLCIVGAAGADAIDGAIARVLGAQSELGKELDSLADLVSFGVAPSLLIYQHYLKDVGLIGVLVCFVFVLFAALRLARFNVHRYSECFEGLPTPVAACWILGLFTVMAYIPHTWMIPIVICFALGLTSILMICRLPYPRAIRFNWGLVFILMFGLLIPQAILLISTSLYIATGLVRYFWHKFSNDSRPNTHSLPDVNAEQTMRRQQQVNA